MIKNLLLFAGICGVSIAMHCHAAQKPVSRATLTAVDNHGIEGLEISLAHKHAHAVRVAARSSGKVFTEKCAPLSLRFGQLDGEYTRMYSLKTSHCDVAIKKIEINTKKLVVRDQHKMPGQKPSLVSDKPILIPVVVIEYEGGGTDAWLYDTHEDAFLAVTLDLLQIIPDA